MFVVSLALVHQGISNARSLHPDLALSAGIIWIHREYLDETSESTVRFDFASHLKVSGCSGVVQPRWLEDPEIHIRRLGNWRSVSGASLILNDSVMTIFDRSGEEVGEINRRGELRLRDRSSLLSVVDLVADREIKQIKKRNGLNRKALKEIIVEDIKKLSTEDRDRRFYNFHVEFEYVVAGGFQNAKTSRSAHTFQLFAPKEAISYEMNYENGSKSYICMLRASQKVIASFDGDRLVTYL